MRIAFVIGGLMLMCALTTVSVSAAALSDYPMPPPPRQCSPCSGPPPPPTPVPTLAAASVALKPVVDVHLSAKDVQRGRPDTVKVEGSTGDAVTVWVHYRVGKATVYRARIGSNGIWEKSWKVPQSAALGKGHVDVAVRGTGGHFARTLAFIVSA